MGFGDTASAAGHLRIIHSKLELAQLTTRPGCVCSPSLMAQLAAYRHLGPVLDLVSLKIHGAGQHVQQVTTGDWQVGHMGGSSMMSSCFAVGGRQA